MWRGAGAVERGGLENRCPPCGGPRVRIPPSPPPKLNPRHRLYLAETLVFLASLVVQKGGTRWFSACRSHLSTRRRTSTTTARSFLSVCAASSDEPKLKSALAPRTYAKRSVATRKRLPR